MTYMIRTAALTLFMSFVFSVNATETAKNKPNLAKAKTTAETVCAGCHGADGNSAIAANPILAGQGEAYLFKQLSNFSSVGGKAPTRTSPIMNGMVAALSVEDMQGLALYFSQQKMKPSIATDPKLAEVGKDLWRKGDFSRGVPACAGCHGPAGAGVPAQYPRLAGQYAEYTDAQLKAFRNEERTNDPAKMMRTIAEKLSDKQIKALSDYIAGLR